MSPSKSTRTLLLGLLLSSGSITHSAAGPADEGWTRIQGNAIDIGISTSGGAHVVDKNNNLWRWQSSNKKWKKLPGKFRRVDTDIEGKPWAVTTSGELRRYQRRHWQLLANNILDVGIGETHVFVTHTNGSISRWNPDSNRLQTIPGSGRYIDVDHDGRPWVVNADGQVMFRKDNRWQLTRLKANDIGLGKDSLYISQQGFELDPNGTRSVSIGPGDIPWLVTNNGHIYVQGLLDSQDTQERQRTGGTTISSRIRWQKVPGRAIDIAIGADATVIALNSNNNIWRWRQTDDKRGAWTGLPGKLLKVTVSPRGEIWGIDTNGKVRQYSKRYWQPGKTRASDIVAGLDGQLAIIRPDGTAAIGDNKTWRELPGILAERIALSKNNSVYVLDKQGRLYQHTDNRWQAIEAPNAIDLAIGPRNSIMLVAQDNRLYRGRPGESKWKLINGKFSAISLGPNDRPWGITTSANILASSFFIGESIGEPGEEIALVDPKDRKGSAEPLPTSRDQLVFKKVNGIARHISIGVDGSVFILDPEGQVLRYSNQKQRFLSFPGGFNNLAVSPSGDPWGIDSGGRVFRHDGQDWREVRNIKATDIAIGAEGSVVVSDAGERLYLYDGKRFNTLRGDAGKQNPRGSLVAVDALGNPWTVRKSGQVYRCDSSPCKRIEGVRARDIAIGPDGSVFIIDKRDVIRRFDDRSNQFERQTTRAAGGISVGPQGKPWIINDDNEIYASAFFKRDESADQAVALRTSDNTASATPGGSSSGFTFSKNLKIETIKVTASGLTLPIDDFAISPTGRVLAIDSAGNIVEYNEKTNTFSRVIYANTPLQRLQMAADETIWGIDAADNFYRQSGNSFKIVSGVKSTATDVVFLAVGADGSVFASSTDTGIYIYDEDKRHFVLFNVQLNGQSRVHGVEPDGDPWAIDEQTLKLYALKNNKFVKKRDNVDFFNIGAGGAVYILDDGAYPNLPVLKYNATNGDFDRTNVTGAGLQVAPDGRLWLWQNGGIIQRAR